MRERLCDTCGYRLGVGLKAQGDPHASPIVDRFCPLLAATQVLVNEFDAGVYDAVGLGTRSQMKQDFDDAREALRLAGEGS